MSSNQPESDIYYLCKLISESIQLPVFYKSNDNEFWSASTYDYQTSPLFLDLGELISSLLKQSRDSAFPVIHTTNFLEQFIRLPFRRNNECLGTLIIGPAVSQVLTDELITNLINDNSVPYKHQPLWNDYLRKLPNFNKLRLFHISVMSHLLVNGEALEIKDVQEYNFRFEQRFVYEDIVELTLANHRELALFHTDPLAEKKLMRNIRLGDKTSLLGMINTLSMENAGVLSKRSHLRNTKNLAISAISLATREAMAGGLQAELAYTLSDLHIQHIEELRDAQAVEVAMTDALIDFTERVSLSKKNGVSKPIAACQEYIFSHMYEDIPLQRLSELTGLNRNYLSHLFKKETGMTISYYIQKERVEEAKRLLELTDEPLSTIASRLNFYDQTHFNKIFKKHTSITPKHYRDRKEAGKQTDN